MDNYWNRNCKTKGCFGIARPLSDYCNKCREEGLERFEEIIK